MFKKTITAALVALSLGTAVAATTSPAAAYDNCYGNSYGQSYNHNYNYHYYNKYNYSYRYRRYGYNGY